MASSNCYNKRIKLTDYNVLVRVSTFADSNPEGAGSVAMLPSLTNNFL